MEAVIIDTDPGIDDVLAIIMMLLSPEVVVKAITLTHGNTTLQNVKRNAVTLMHVMQQHREFLGQKAPLQELPVLAVGCEGPLKCEPITATYFHGPDGLGDIFRKEMHAAPAGWENQLLHEAQVSTDKAFENNVNVNKAFQTTPRDAADEILHQLKEAPPFSVSILAVGPLTNVALAYQRDPVTFSRVKRVVIMGGAIDYPGNVTPMAEFNFRADPTAADIVMSASKGFQHTPEGYRARLELVVQGKKAPCHIVILPLDGSDDGMISVEEYQQYILPLNGQSPLATFCNKFLVWSFEVCAKLYNLTTLAVYDAYTGLLLLDMMHDKGDGEHAEDVKKHWEYRYLDLRVEHAGVYTLGMCCYDRRFWHQDKPSWNDEPNNVQVFMRGNGKRFAKEFLYRVFGVNKDI